MAFVSYIVENDKLFKAAVIRASEAVDDLRVPFGLIMWDFYKSEQAIFKLKSAGKYPDFKSGGADSPYAKRKQKLVGFQYPLLVRSGRLAASMLNPLAQGAIARIDRLSLTIGTSIEYGIYHQSDAPRTKIPLRKFLFIGPEAPEFASSEQTGRTERWLNIINDYVLKKMKQSGAFNGK